MKSLLSKLKIILAVLLLALPLLAYQNSAWAGKDGEKAGPAFNAPHKREWRPPKSGDIEWYGLPKYVVKPSWFRNMLGYNYILYYNFGGYFLEKNGRERYKSINAQHRLVLSPNNYTLYIGNKQFILLPFAMSEKKYPPEQHNIIAEAIEQHANKIKLKPEKVWNYFETQYLPMRNLENDQIILVLKDSWIGNGHFIIRYDDQGKPVLRDWELPIEPVLPNTLIKQKLYPLHPDQALMSFGPKQRSFSLPLLIEDYKPTQETLAKKHQELEAQIQKKQKELEVVQQRIKTKDKQLVEQLRQSWEQNKNQLLQTRNRIITQQDAAAIPPFLDLIRTWFAIVYHTHITGNTTILNTMAETAENNGNYKAAAQLYEAIANIQIKKRGLEYKTALNSALENWGAFDKSDESFALIRAGDIARKGGDLKNAIGYYLTATEIDRYNPKIGNRVPATMVEAVARASNFEQFTTLTGIYFKQPTLTRTYDTEPADNPPKFLIAYVNGRSYDLEDVLGWNNNSHPTDTDGNVRMLEHD